MGLQRSDAGFGVVKNRRGKRRIGAARREDVDEVIAAAGASRRDHGNRYGARDRRGHLAVESRLGTVAIDRGQQNLAGARGPVTLADRCAGSLTGTMELTR